MTVVTTTDQTDADGQQPNQAQRRQFLTKALAAAGVSCFPGSAVSCVAENSLPRGVVYRPVLEEEVRTYPNLRERLTLHDVPDFQRKRRRALRIINVNRTPELFLWKESFSWE